MAIIRKLVIFICVISLISAGFAQEVRAQEKKGFFVRMWERFKTRSEEQKTEAPVPKTLAVPKPKPAEPVLPKTPEPEAPAVKKVQVPVSKERMMASIEKATQAYPEIFDIMPGLVRKGTIRGGEELYYGPQDGVKLKVNSLDGKELFELFQKVSRAAVTAMKQRQEAPPVVPKEPEPEPKLEPNPEPEIKPDLKEEVSPELVTIRTQQPLEADEFVEDIDFSEELPEEEPAASGEATTRPEIPVSKEKMLEIIKKRLDIYSELIFMVPDLAFRETTDGGKQYYFAPADQIAQKIEDLDKETLHKLFVRINNEATRINTQRLMRQLQQQEMMTRQIMRTIQSPPKPPPQPPQPPRVYTPPQPQQPPKPPPQPPKQPQVTGPPRR